MRSLLLSVTLLAGISGGAIAQQAVPVTPQGVPPGANPDTGARPGNDVGTKESLPRGDRASNIDEATTRSPIAPNLPTPQVGDEASPATYLHNAKEALSRGRTGEAQEALERAETRMLDEPQAGDQSNREAIQRIHDARHALADSNRSHAEELIDDAMNTASH